MDTNAQKPQMILLSRRHLRSNPSLSSTLTLSPDTQCITKTSSISTFPSTMGLTNTGRFPAHETLPRHPPCTGPLPDPSVLRNARSWTPSCFPNPMTESSRSTREAGKRSVRCTSPLNYAFLRWSLFTTPSFVTNGRIASNPFFRRRESDGSKRTYAMWPIATL